MADPFDLLRDLWDVQIAFGESVDAWWRDHMEEAIGTQIDRIGASATKTLVNSIVDALDAEALALGEDDELETMMVDITKAGYAVGAEFTRQRVEQARAGKLEGDPSSIRVDKALPGADELIALFDFTTVHDEAVDQLRDMHLLWFRDRSGTPYLDKDALAAIKENAGKLIEEGRDGAAVADALRKEAERLYGVGRFTKSTSYWAGVAENAATVSAVTAQINEMVELGWTRYELINPMDQRTTPICQQLNGKVAYVEHVAAANDAMLSATTVADVKSTKPFHPTGSGAAVQAAIGTSAAPGTNLLSKPESQALSDAGLGQPPFHFRCRTYIDVFVAS